MPDVPSVAETIETVNVGLRVLSGEENVTYVDNIPTLHLADGTVNDGYLLRGGVHLTRIATNKLARNLSLKSKDCSKGVCAEYVPNRQAKNEQHHRTNSGSSAGPRKLTFPINNEKSTESDKQHSLRRSFWDNARQKPQRHHQYLRDSTGKKPVPTQVIASSSKIQPP